MPSRRRNTGLESSEYEHDITLTDLSGRTPAELRAIVAQLDADLADLHLDDAGELRELDGGEQDRFDRLMNLRGRAEARLRQHDAIERAYNGGRGVETAYGNLGEPVERGGWVTAPGSDPSLARFRTDAMRVVERHRRNDVLSARAADTVDGVLRRGDPNAITARYTAAVANDHYLSAFGKMCGDPQMGHLRFSREEVEAVREVTYASNAAEMRAQLTTGTTGFPLPLTVDASFIMSGSGALNPVRDISNVVTIGTHDWVGVSSDGVTAGYVQEGVEATDATPTIAGPKISTAQGRAFVQFTIESGQDWPSLQNELLRLVTDARSVTDATAFLTGNGTNAPYGVFGGNATYSLTTSQRVLTATTAAYAVADPWSLKAALPARFTNDATFAAAPATFDTTFRFVGGNSTEPYQFSGGDRGGDFLGRPRAEWSTMATGTTTGTKLMIGGNFGVGYKIVDRLGMSAELIPHMLGSNRLPLGTRGLYCYWRTGAAVVAQNALRYLEVK
jgi:HK97 family phage major capsid protein